MIPPTPTLKLTVPTVNVNPGPCPHPQIQPLTHLPSAPGFITVTYKKKRQDGAEDIPRTKKKRKTLELNNFYRHQVCITFYVSCFMFFCKSCCSCNTGSGAVMSCRAVVQILCGKTGQIHRFYRPRGLPSQTSVTLIRVHLRARGKNDMKIHSFQNRYLDPLWPPLVRGNSGQGGGPDAMK